MESFEVFFELIKFQKKSKAGICTSYQQFVLPAIGAFSQEK